MISFIDMNSNSGASLAFNFSMSMSIVRSSLNSKSEVMSFQTVAGSQNFDRNVAQCNLSIILILFTIINLFTLFLHTRARAQVLQKYSFSCPRKSFFYAYNIIRTKIIFYSPSVLLHFISMRTMYTLPISSKYMFIFLHHNFLLILHRVHTFLD